LTAGGLENTFVRRRANVTRTAELLLTEEEQVALEALARETGKTEGELIHDALAGLLGRQDRLANLRQARGVWKERQDLPDFRALRSELDRF
jgi:hypothetical protein